MLLSWIPYVLMYFPATVTPDGMYQINQGLGLQTLTNHHPVVSTAFFAVFIQIGKFIGNDYFGVFLIAVFQMIFISYSFSLIIKLTYKISNKKWLVYITTIFFCIYPTWGMMVQAVIKDTMFVGFFAIFMVCFVEIVLYPDDFWRSKKLNFLFVISMLGICFWRNNGIYILYFLLVFGLFFKLKKNRKIKFASVTIGIIIFYQVTNMFIYPIMNVEKGSINEALSIPYQQTARYVTMYEDELTGEEISIISSILDYDTLIESYNPELSDPVKFAAQTPTKLELKEYLKVWFEMLLKHPLVYFEATFNNIYNYFYFCDSTTAQQEFYTYTSTNNRGLEIDREYSLIRGGEELMEITSNTITKLPILNLLNKCGFYTWMLLILITLFIKNKKYNYIILSIPLIILILVCIGSPVNGLQRYMWPVMATITLLIACIFEKE